jgi:hypothetical protein
MKSIIATGILTILLLATPAAFAAPAQKGTNPVSGAWADTALLGLKIHGNIEKAIISGNFYGNIPGTYIAYSTVTVWNSTYATYKATDVCTCAIENTQTLTFNFTETGSLTLVQTPAGPVFALQSTATAKNGTGNILPGIYTKVVIDLSGALNPATDLSTGSWAGTATYTEP